MAVATSQAINNDSILTTVKKLLGIEESYTAFDTDLVIHINSVFSILTQMGIGPSIGFAIINKDEKWVDYIGEETILVQSLKSYMAAKVKLMFDPPSNTNLLESTTKVVDELEKRLYIEFSNAAFVPDEPVSEE